MKLLGKDFFAKTLLLRLPQYYPLCTFPPNTKDSHPILKIHTPCLLCIFPHPMSPVPTPRLLCPPHVSSAHPLSLVQATFLSSPPCVFLYLRIFMVFYDTYCLPIPISLASFHISSHRYWRAC